MDTQDRKLQQRIARRKEKVQQLIEQQNVYLAVLDPDNYQCWGDYLQVQSRSRNKLHQLKQELLALETGHFPGA